MAHTRPDSGMLARSLQSQGEFDLTNGGADDINEATWTGLATGITRMRLCFYDLASAATPGVPEILLGDATTGGYVATNYKGLVADTLDNLSFATLTGTEARITEDEVAVISIIQGAFIDFTLMNATLNIWQIASKLVQPDGSNPEHHQSIWHVALAGDVDRVKLQSSKAALWTNGRAILLTDK